jgi:hypothetical protein
MQDGAAPSEGTGNALDELLPPRALVDFVGGSDYHVMGVHLLRLLIAVGGLRVTVVGQFEI